MIKPGNFVKVKDGSFVLKVGSGGIDRYLSLAVDNKRNLKVLATNCVLPGETFLGKTHINDAIVQDIETEEIFFIKAQFLTPVETKTRIPNSISSNYVEQVPEFYKKGI